MKNIVFCLPAHNEEELMKTCVRQLHDYLLAKDLPFIWKIAILVNGSHDNSWNIALDLANKNPQTIEAFEYSVASKGGAIKNYWNTSEADILTYMDIDLAVSLDNIEDLIAAIEDGADLAVGSRLMKKSKTDRSAIRTITSYGYNILAQLILREKLPDLQCGFKAIKNEVFKKLSPNILEKKWFFDTELVVFAKHYGYKLKALPVNWEEGRYQKRKTKVKLILDSLILTKDLIELKKRIKKSH